MIAVSVAAELVQLAAAGAKLATADHAARDRSR
jgi:xanthine/CO dehydrogenase XdhC/CoxF family maturation factor